MFWNKRMFSSGGDVAVNVADVEAARQWYSEKFKLPYSSTRVEEANMELGYSAEAVVIYLVRVSSNKCPDKSSRRPPIMFARNLTQAHASLSSRGVDAGPIQSDSGGNQFFRFRDLEGNELEVCQED
jgi:hypothetical protein